MAISPDLEKRFARILQADSPAKALAENAGQFSHDDISFLVKNLEEVLGIPPETSATNGHALGRLSYLLEEFEARRGRFGGNGEVIPSSNKPWEDPHGDRIHVRKLRAPSHPLETTESIPPVVHVRRSLGWTSRERLKDLHHCNSTREVDETIELTRKSLIERLTTLHGDRQEAEKIVSRNYIAVTDLKGGRQIKQVSPLAMEEVCTTLRHLLNRPPERPEGWESLIKISKERSIREGVIKSITDSIVKSSVQLFRKAHPEISEDIALIMVEDHGIGLKYDSDFTTKTAPQRYISPKVKAIMENHGLLPPEGNTERVTTAKGSFDRVKAAAPEICALLEHAYSISPPTEERIVRYRESKENKYRRVSSTTTPEAGRG